jgi:hypothetical protein
MYPVGPDEAKQLFNSVVKLRQGMDQSIAAHRLPGVEAVDNIKLYFKLGAGDLGVQSMDGHNRFQCVLSKDSWSQVSELIMPFCEPLECVSHQWIDETSGISLLITTSDIGAW